MDRFDRIFKLHQIMAARRTAVSRRVLEERLECSRATVMRGLDDLRDYLDAPLVFDTALQGWKYDDRGQTRFELPGLWFSSDELFALLTTHHLLANIQPGLLDEYLQPFLERIESLLEVQDGDWGQISQRVKILQAAARSVNVDQFRKVAGALVQRRQLNMLYHGRARDETSERVVSPQRLVYYRDNWYLDAWCHQKKALRSFSLDRLHPLPMDEEPAYEVSEEDLEAHFTRGYGIFAGVVEHVAQLRFTAEAARWVADEQWHPQQRDRVLADGRYELWVPYSDVRELLGEVMKYGASVEVLAPSALREQVAEELRAAVLQYDARVQSD